MTPVQSADDRISTQTGHSGAFRLLASVEWTCHGQTSIGHPLNVSVNRHRQHLYAMIYSNDAADREAQDRGHR
jgi:hypothetical protein